MSQVMRTFVFAEDVSYSLGRCCPGICKQFKSERGHLCLPGVCSYSGIHSSEVWNSGNPESMRMNTPPSPGQQDEESQQNWTLGKGRKKTDLGRSGYSVLTNLLLAAGLRMRSLCKFTWKKRDNAETFIRSEYSLSQGRYHGSLDGTGALTCAPASPATFQISGSTLTRQLKAYRSPFQPVETTFSLCLTRFSFSNIC